MTARLAQIQARADNPFGTILTGIAQADEDRDYLLAMVRERDAALDAAKADAWDEGYGAGKRVMIEVMSPIHFATEQDNPYRAGEQP